MAELHYLRKQNAKFFWGHYKIFNNTANVQKQFFFF